MASSRKQLATLLFNFFWGGFRPAEGFPLDKNQEMEIVVLWKLVWATQFSVWLVYIYKHAYVIIIFFLNATLKPDVS